MRSYCFIERSDEDVSEWLDSRYPSVVEGDKKRWNTPFGISFATPSYMDKHRVDWFFIYDSVGSTLMQYGMDVGSNGEKGGWIDKGGIIHLTKQLDMKPEGFSVFDKPHSILKLEEIYGEKANLHCMHCLQWSFKIKNFVSCVNNPFDLRHCYAGGDDNFEVFFFGDEEPLEYVWLPDLLVEIKNRRGTPKNCCGYCWTVRTPMKKCGRCKKVYYCGVECQTKDWKEGRHVDICKDLGK